MSISEARAHDGRARLCHVPPERLSTPPSLISSRAPQVTPRYPAYPFTRSRNTQRRQ
ncbi:hypothetical protein FA95DRAFT_1567904 [Auriscalpium vulgare]|uniref:Uncharacterized protein n=1 Tax=Auriscalpium vulgare TaxID=40419 RepID=A0ACB8R3C2_9AGAM|nr:hypothetical protein FA95DRAFT_1567904 [Auriscalpium vulgare]